MTQTRSCDLYNDPKDDCECIGLCGRTHTACPEHSEQPLARWPPQPSVEICSDSSSASPKLLKDPLPNTSLVREHEESAAEVLERYERCNELMSICLALSTSNLTAALKEYYDHILEWSYWFKDKAVVREFREIIKLASQGSFVEEVDIYQMAETMTTNLTEPFKDDTSISSRTYLAARKYRMLIQWCGGKFGVDRDILKVVEALLEIQKNDPQVSHWD